MGLDTTHDAWHGPYGSFNQFRKWLASKIGINLDEYYGYGNGGTKKLSSIPNDLKYLFDHSDCDGDITPLRCKKIAKAIDEVLKKVKEDDVITNYQKTNAIQFRNGCLKAFKKKEKLQFH